MKIGDTIEIIGTNICTTYNLKWFRFYMGEDRCSFMERGRIVEQHEPCKGLYTWLVKSFKTNKVLAYRSYEPLEEGL